MNKIYAIDIDGTLTLETDGWDYNNRTPNVERIRGVNKLYEAGNTIILFTARFIEDEEVTRHWLSFHNVQYHRLVLGKIQYDVIIDDKAAPLELLEIL